MVEISRNLDKDRENFKKLPTIIHGNYVGSFCIKCKARNIPADDYFHEGCGGPTILVWTEIGDSAQEIVAKQLEELTNNNQLTLELLDKYGAM